MNLMDLMVKISAKDDASGTIGGVAKNAQSAASAMQKAFDGAGSSMGRAIGDAVKEMEIAAANAKRALEGIGSNVSPSLQGMAAAAKYFGDAAEQSASRTNSALNGINFSGITNGISSAANAIGNGFQSAAGVASRAVEGLKSAIGGIGSAASSAASAAKSAFDAIATAAGNVVSAVEGGLSTMGKIGLTVGGAAAAGVGVLSKKAIDSYAEYEQLVGGVETLFGAGGRTLEEYAAWKGIDVDEAAGKYNSLLAAQEKVLQNADNAYFTAGLSANDYMDTATFLSASLIQSLAGDTVGAADMIQMAMTDMSDNANKFGSDMTSIMNAYKGFSKQNFTMLDNLKLGYGGTKGEMARLLNDANAIDSSILGAGVVLDTSGQNILDGIGFDQMIKAINVIQTQMDITGTTASEALNTIQGSGNMAKAAWADMMTAIADDNADFSGSIDKVVSSTNTALQNLIPRIQQSFVGISNLIGELAPTIISTVPDLVSSALPGMTDAISGIISAAAEAIPGLTESVINALPDVAQSFAGIGDTLVKAIDGVASSVVGAFANFLQESTGIDVTPLVESTQTAISTVTGAISGMFAGMNISTGAADVVNEVIQTLASTIDYLLTVVQGDTFRGLGQAIFGAFSGIGSSLAEHMRPAVDAIGELVMSFMSGDSGHIDRIKTSIENFTGIFTEHIAPIIGTISGSVVDMLGSFLTIGAEVIEGIVNVLRGFFGMASDEDKTNRFQVLAIAVGEILGAFTRDLKPIIDIVKKAIQDLFEYWFGSEGDIEGFEKKLRGVKTVFGEIARQIEVVIENFAQWIADVFDSEATSEEKWESFGEIVGNAFGVIMDAITGVVNWFLDWKGALEDIKALIDGIIKGYKEIISKPADKEFSAQEFEKLYGSKALSDSTKAEAAGEKIGSAIENGIANGLINENSKVIQSMQKTLINTEKSAMKAIDAHSPSKRYMKLGGYMIEGLRLGWERGADGMIAEMRSSYAAMERVEQPELMRVDGGSALGKITTDLANAMFGAAATVELSGSGTPVNLVVDGKALATVMLDPLRGVMKQKGLEVLHA